MENCKNGIPSTCIDQTVVLGNSVDIKLEGCQASEVRADVVVEKSESAAIRLWGQINDCEGEPVSNALIKLVKVTCVAGKKEYRGVAHTVSDSEGFYQFDVCGEKDACYKVLVGKSNRGPEQVIVGNGNGEVCTENRYNPCKEYKQIIVDATQCSCKDQGNSTQCGCKDQGNSTQCGCKDQVNTTAVNQGIQPSLMFPPVQLGGTLVKSVVTTVPPVADIVACSSCASVVASSQTGTCKAAETTVTYPRGGQGDSHNYQYQSTINRAIPCK